MLSATSNALEFAQICPKPPKIAKICPKTISLGNFEILPKIEILMFFKKLKAYVRRGTNAYAHLLGFQYNNFGDVFSIVKKQPLLVNFSIPHCGKYFFPQRSTFLMGMRLCRHVPN
jgi:hypothetical protein